MKTILVLSAQPQGSVPLDLAKEVRMIREALQLSNKREDFKLESRSAVRWKDVRRAIAELNPEIVQFSGHGEGKKGLVFEDDEGPARMVSADALMRMFKLFPVVECVVLNACHSEVQAEAIVKVVPWVVGMSQTILDRSARDFSEGFYDGLGAGRGYKEAFELGLSGIANDVEVWTPVLLEGKVKEKAEEVKENTEKIALTRTQQSNLRELARLEQDLAAVEESLDTVLDSVTKRRLQEHKRQLLEAIETLEQKL
ncbi:MAG: CHAT domain-containing protein [Alkalinema sp. RU_4_3]|nr:CHAT domain-containing protein [Alkalinema sp. RU_4_3]